MEYWKDPEKRVKQGNLSRGRKPNAEARRKMSESQKKRFERDGPYIPTAIDRAKISAAQMGHTVSAESRTKIGAKNKGRKHTPEELAKMSAAKKGKPFSVTHRKAIAAARRGKPSGMLGKNHSPETIEKMRAASVKRARASCIRCHREMTVNNLVIHFRTHEHADMKLKAEEERP